MIAISCDNISLSFGAETILEDVSFSLNEGDKMGIVGVNGAGKSTLFHIIGGEYTPDSGSVYISRGKEVGFLAQQPIFSHNNTLLEEMLAAFAPLIEEERALSELQRQLEAGDHTLADRYAAAHDRFTKNGGYEFRGRCKGMLKSMGFDESLWNTNVSALSGGQKTRVALSRLLLREPDILLLDEPTNHLDMDTLYYLEDYLRNYRKTVLVISHDRYFLDRVTNKTLEIENGRSKLYNGNYSAYVEQKRNDREIQERHYKNQQKEIARIEAYIEQQRRWNRERNIIAAESREKQLAKMERVEKPSALPESIRLRFEKSGESGNDVLMLRGLSKSYPGKALFHDVNLLIKKNEHAFLLGSNGCGKSTLLKVIMGRVPPDSGEVEYGYNVQVGYYDQEIQQLTDSNTVLDELWNAYPNLTQTQIRNALALFLFKGDDIGKEVGVLSGGERARLTLVKLILSSMNFLILDEPTNHLDISSREALENALLRFDGTILAVSHDRYFINKLANRILSFEGGEGLADFRGNLDEYLAYKSSRASAETVSAVTEEPSDSKKSYMEAKKNQSEQRKFERKVRMTEEAIEKLEAELEEISAAMEGEAAADYKKITELAARQSEAEQKLSALYEELESLTG